MEAWGDMLACHAQPYTEYIIIKALTASNGFSLCQTSLKQRMESFSQNGLLGARSNKTDR